MVRICRSLTLDAAITIEVAATASLGWHASVIWTGRIGAGLGRPVARGAQVMRRTVLFQTNTGEEGVRNITSKSIIQALEATGNMAAPANCK